MLSFRVVSYYAIRRRNDLLITMAMENRTRKGRGDAGEIGEVCIQ